MRDGDAKDALRRERMTARAMIGEEVAVATPFPLMEADGVGVVFATDGRFELAELDPVWLLGILLGFGDFADHAGVHGFTLAFFVAADIDATAVTAGIIVERRRAVGRLFRPRASLSKRRWYGGVPLLIPSLKRPQSAHFT